jgi:hypothetical protein
MNALLALSVVVIVAHHDDEILWFEPWLDQASEVIVMMPTTPTYDEVRQKEQQLYGTKVKNLWGRTEDVDYLDYWVDKEARADSINYHSLKQLLRKHFKNSENTTFLTHNPWGEYGHYHHKLLYKVARDLAIEYKKTLIVDGVRYDDGYTYNLTPTSQFMSYDMCRFSEVRSLFQSAVFPGTSLDAWTWNDTDSAVPGYSQDVPYSQVIVNGAPVDMEELERYETDAPLPWVGAPTPQ